MTSPNGSKKKEDITKKFQENYKKVKDIGRNAKAAYDVWRGKYGNGEERKKKLEKAGYDYKKVQSLVNKGVGRNASKDWKKSSTSSTSYPKSFAKSERATKGSSSKNSGTSTKKSDSKKTPIQKFTENYSKIRKA